MRDAVIALRAELDAGACRSAGTARWAVPDERPGTGEPGAVIADERTGKNGDRGQAAAAPFAWHSSAPGATPPPGLMAGPPNSSSRPSPRSHAAVVIVATVLMLRGVDVDESKKATSSPGRSSKQRHDNRSTTRTCRQSPRSRSVIAPGTDVRVLSAGERSPRQIVLFCWPKPSDADGAITLTYGDGRAIQVVSRWRESSSKRRRVKR